MFIYKYLFEVYYSYYEKYYAIYPPERGQRYGVGLESAPAYRLGFFVAYKKDLAIIKE